MWFYLGSVSFQELGSNKLNHISLGSFDYVATLLDSMGSFHGPNALMVIVYDLLWFVYKRMKINLEFDNKLWLLRKLLMLGTWESSEGVPRQEARPVTHYQVVVGLAPKLCKGQERTCQLCRGFICPFMPAVDGSSWFGKTIETLRTETVRWRNEK